MSPPRALVIGLDGVSKWLLEHLVERGIMPSVRRLLSEGTLAPLRAPIPELSSTSWATFLTGVNPGRHGIFGFVDLKPGTYNVHFPNLDDLAAAPLWDLAAEANLRTVCLNVPGTFPARPISGVLVSGFVALDLSRSTHPPGLAPELEACGYTLDVDTSMAATDPRVFLRAIHRSLDARARVHDILLSRERWDLAAAVVTETDRVQHFLWNRLINERDELHDEVLDVYRHVDNLVARLIAHAGDARLFLVSDHGFAAVKCEVRINTWLRQRGYLHLAPTASQLADLGSSSVAFALDPGRIYLCRKRRYAAGRLDDASADRLREHIREELLALRWQGGDQIGEGEGEPVFAEVLRNDEAYAGPLIGSAPDLVAVARDGFHLRGSWYHEHVGGHDVFTGVHTRGDAIFYARGAVLEKSSVDMQDVIPTVLSTLGVNRYEKWDGVNVLR